MAPQQPTTLASKRPRTAAPPAASGVPSPPVPLSVADLLEMDSLQTQTGHLAKWAQEAKEYVDNALLKFLTDRHTEFCFQVPASVMLIPPMKMSAAASGAHLTSFREVMNYDSLQLSFSKKGQYEAAGTVWMLDPIDDGTSDTVSISQLEGAMAMWTEERFLLSSEHPPSRRYSLVAPLPARVVNTKVAQRMSEGESIVLMAT